MVVFTDRIGSHQEKPSTAFNSARVRYTKTATVLYVLLTLSYAVHLSHECDCLVRRNCCNKTCPLRVSCDPPCSEGADRDSLLEGECFDGKCNWTCTEPSNCTGCFLRGWQVTLESAVCGSNPLECIITFCRNGSCVWGVRDPTDDKDSQKLGPMLLAIVAVSGLLIFGCLFYCCLDQMKSDRVSVKIRMARRRQRKAKRTTLAESKEIEHSLTAAKFEAFNPSGREVLAAIPEEDCEDEEEEV